MRGKPEPRQVGNIGAFCHLLLNKKVFLVRRAYRDRLWSLPGGAIEQGESLAAGLRREVAEETGYQVENPRYVCTFYSPSLYSIAVCFWEEVRGTIPMPRTSEEISDCGWFPIDGLPDEMSDRQRNWVRTFREYLLTEESLGVRESDV